MHMQMCRTFAQTGSCRYGKRCRFIHPENSTDLNLLPNTPPQTDNYTMYQSPILAQEPCTQQLCSGLPCNPDSLSYASPQAITPYSEVHPATYQDQFLRPIPVTSDPAHFQTSPYTSPYASSAGSVHNGHAYSVMTSLPTLGSAHAVNSSLLGSGYSNQQPDCCMLSGAAPGGQSETSPRGVLECAALQSCGYTSGDGGHCDSHSQVGAHSYHHPVLHTLAYNVTQCHLPSLACTLHS